jgi:DNA-binding transcriptional ArsR family regulator
LTTFLVNARLLHMPDVAVLEDPAAAAIALDPVRALVLASLAAEPASAAGVAARVGLARQKVGYHLNALAEHGLVVEVDQRRHGGLTERIFAASAAAYVVSPGAMGAAGADPDRIADRLSASYLIASAARIVREVGVLTRLASDAGKRLPTLSVDADIRFRSAAERAAFAEELATTVRGLAARYHDEAVPDGRWYRVAAFAHPRPQEESS